MDFADEGFRRRPVDARVGDGDAVAQVFFRLGEGLVAGAEVAFDHGAHDAVVAADDLCEDLADDFGLALGLFRGVVVRAVDQDGFGEPGFGEELLGLGDVRGRVVRAGGAAAENDVAIGIAAGDDGGGGAVEIDTEKSLGLGGGLDGVDGGGDGTVGAVLETERHRQTRGHLAVGLRFGGAGADGGPADEVGNVLRGDGVEELGGGGQTEVEDVAEERAGEPEAVGDVVGAVEMGVHHEAFPADGGARFFEVDAHNDHHAVGDFLGEGGESASVVAAGLEVMDRARADDEKEAFVVGEDETLDLATGVGDESGLRFGLRDFGEERGGRRKGAGFDDVDVGCSLHEWNGELGPWERHGASSGFAKREAPKMSRRSEIRFGIWAKKVAGRLPLSGPPLLS